MNERNNKRGKERNKLSVEIFKNGMGNGEAKDLIYMTHGHELRWGNDGGRWGTGWRGIKRRKKWDNCNSIINKIYRTIIILVDSNLK